mmetsp:Transcript_13454/g.16717  ORF Transcript_13454/g.16717 Transcript_13454/m.16717 type:complete len:223 (-) Transcript_13454:769-1437(-)
MSFKVSAWINVFGVSYAVLSVLKAWKVDFRELSRSGPNTTVFQSKLIFTHFNPEVSHFSPVLSPAVANDPVFISSGLILTPSHDGNDMINHSRLHRHIQDTTVVVYNLICIHTASHWPTSVNFFHDIFCTINFSIFSNRSVREGSNATAKPSHRGKGRTSTAGVHVRAFVVSMRTISFFTLSRAGFVLQTGIIRNESSFLDELVRRTMTSTMARSSHFGTAV